MKWPLAVSPATEPVGGYVTTGEGMRIRTWSWPLGAPERASVVVLPPGGLSGLWLDGPNSPISPGFLAAIGFRVVSLDPMGAGGSWGEPDLAGRGECASLAATLGRVDREAGDRGVVLLSVGGGALLALRLLNSGLEAAERVRGVVLLNPVTSAAALREERSRAGQVIAEGEGFWLSRDVEGLIAAARVPLRRMNGMGELASEPSGPLGLPTPGALVSRLRGAAGLERRRSELHNRAEVLLAEILRES